MFSVEILSSCRCVASRAGANSWRPKILKMTEKWKQFSLFSIYTLPHIVVFQWLLYCKEGYRHFLSFQWQHFYTDNCVAEFWGDTKAIWFVLW